MRTSTDLEPELVMTQRGEGSHSSVDEKKMEEQALVEEFEIDTPDMYASFATAQTSCLTEWASARDHSLQTRMRWLRPIS